MDALYVLRDAGSILTPSLLFYKDIIRRNLERAIGMVGGDPSRLRPHAKTHKTAEIIRLCLEAGVTKHKVATLAEAELLARAGAPDVLIAYPLVGPNCGRLARLIAAYPQTRFSVLADSPEGVRALSDALAAAGRRVEVLLDVDVGMHRTGIAPGPAAVALYEQIATSPGLTAGGIHVYDGHNSQESPAERAAAVTALVGPVLELRRTLEGKGLPVPRLVAGGTPTFPMWAARSDIPGLECSPGTLILSDHNTRSRFPDLAGFQPAAILLTRVISKPTPRRLTLDLGYKAVASDPPAGKRLAILNVPDYEAVLQSEEHLCVETPHAEQFAPGDVVYAVPAHVCPTCALHRHVYVIEDGRVTATWDVAGRDRVLTV
jgi:D-serine deaminase-like pyridoxal phosphate-dependent protein